MMATAPATSHAGDLEQLRVIVYRDADLYIAQGLEVDIATQAKDIPSLLARLDLTIEAECAMSKERGGAPFDGIGAAPNYFHGLWENAVRRAEAFAFPDWPSLQVCGSCARGMSRGLSVRRPSDP
jgi:hypothetical protein